MFPAVNTELYPVEIKLLAIVFKLAVVELPGTNVKLIKYGLVVVHEALQPLTKYVLVNHKQPFKLKNKLILS
jgi:hypothetical protein